MPLPCIYNLRALHKKDALFSEKKNILAIRVIKKLPNTKATIRRKR
jgi:hypothetical protein